MVVEKSGLDLVGVAHSLALGSCDENKIKRRVVCREGSAREAGIGRSDGAMQGADNGSMAKHLKR